MNEMKNRWIRLLAAGLLAAGITAAAGVAMPDAAEAQRGSEAQADDAPSGVVNINTATSEELQRLPGVGPSKAEAIIALRERHGGYERIEQILHVRGIGRATFRRLRSMIAVDGETTLE